MDFLINKLGRVATEERQNGLQNLHPAKCLIFFHLFTDRYFPRKLMPHEINSLVLRKSKKKEGISVYEIN